MPMSDDDAKYGHTYALWEQLDKEEEARGLPKRQVEALEKIAHLLAQIFEDGLLVYDGHNTVVSKKDETT